MRSSRAAHAQLAGAMRACRRAPACRLHILSLRKRVASPSAACFHKLGTNARLSLALARLGIGRSSRRGDGSSRNAHARQSLPDIAVHTSRSSWPIGRFRMRPMRANHVRFARFNLLASAVHGLLRFLANSQCVRLGDINAPRHSRVHRQRRRTTRSLVVFLPHRAMAELHTNRDVFHGKQRRAESP